MKKLLALMAGLTAAIACAQPATTVLNVLSYYSQNANPMCSVSMNATSFDSGVPGSFDSVEMSGPDGFILGTSADGYSGSYYVGGGTAFTLFWTVDYYTALEEIANGNYAAKFTGGTLDGVTLSYEVNTAFIPVKAPLFSDASIRRVQFARSTRDIKVAFPAQQTRADAVSAFLTFSIQYFDENQGFWTEAFWSILPIDAKSVVIPANTLGNGQYSMHLSYAIIGSESTDGLSVQYFLSNNYSFSRTAALATEIPDHD
jgi:hypothetical protein